MCEGRSSHMWDYSSKLTRRRHPCREVSCRERPTSTPGFHLSGGKRIGIRLREYLFSHAIQPRRFIIFKEAMVCYLIFKSPLATTASFESISGRPSPTNCGGSANALEPVSSSSLYNLED